jgi:hypothetical protein
MMRPLTPGFRRRSRVAAPSATAAAVLLGTALLAGCDRFDQLLTVETPSRLSEANFLVPANAALISTSAVADFECALGGYIVASGLAGGEFIETTQTAARWSYDRRDVLPADALYATSGCAAIGVYTPINTARFTNDQAVAKLEEWTDAQVPNRQRLIATNAAMAGYALVLLGEGFCECTINVGPILTSQQAFDSAVVRFTKAIEAATAANEANLRNLALVGRARARLNRGDAAGAAADAAQVPQGFVYNATADANAARRNNRIFAQNNNGLAVSVAPAYRNLNDPRVVATDGGRNASDQLNRLWNQGKYASLTAPFPIATWVEAQLIRAEAAGGQAGVDILNALRARAGVALAPLPASAATNFRDALVEERRRELWLQGNRYYDIRRFNLPLVPAVGTPYGKGGLYGDQRCWPLPDAERLANPNS